MEAGAPVVVTRNGIRFAFLGLNQIDPHVWADATTPGTAPLSSEHIGSIKAKISYARSVADVVIILPQWGIEYATQPNKYQRTWAKEFLDAGATLVIGNHPHIIQPVEEFPNGLVFYALGNFVFDQSKRQRREGFAVEAIFRGVQLEGWNILPVLINYYTYQPAWAEGEDAKIITAKATQP